MTVRRSGLSVRWKLTLSYTGFLLVAWLSFVVLMVLVLRFVPDDEGLFSPGSGAYIPNQGDLIDVAVPAAAWGTIALLVVGLVGGWFLAGHMLKPLQAINNAARDAAAGSLSHRIRMTGPDDEFRRTADVLDSMLSRLEHAFDEQRRFTSNTSHELRTPLATMKTMLEVAAAQKEDADVTTLVERLQTMNDRSIDTIEALLRLAHIDQVDPTLDAWDLADIARDGCRLVTEEADRSRIRLDVELSPTPVTGDPALLRHLVGNLLLNAVRHNTAADGWVRMRTMMGPERRAILEVENTGTVLDPAMVATLTEPFVRGVGRVRSATGRTGSGLGLSIVASVVRVHSAELFLRARPDGGLCVTVRFPTVAGGRTGPTTGTAPGHGGTRGIRCSAEASS